MSSSHPTSHQEDSSRSSSLDLEELDDDLVETETVRIRRKQRRRFRLTRQQFMLGFFAFFGLLILISVIWFQFQQSGY